MTGTSNPGYHIIKFSTEGEEHKEYCISVLPLTEFHDASLDHHIQLKIVEYMRKNGIKDRESEYRYYDDKDNLIIFNDKPLEHGIYKVLEENNEKSKTEIDEVISRRGFFKKAAGSILPILGAVIFSSIPHLTNATPEYSSPMNCNRSCSGSCSGDCAGSCSSGCSGGCGVACSGYCDNACGYGCNSSCKNSCSRTCKAYCKDGCTSCKGYCGNNCKEACIGGCKTTCSGSCGFFCDNTCTGTCTSNCKESCSSYCKGLCGSGCSNNCSNTCRSVCANNCTANCQGRCQSISQFS